MLEASTEFQRQSPCDRPRVAAIRGREPHVVLRNGWIVIELDLRRSSDLSCCAAGEDQAGTVPAAPRSPFPWMNLLGMYSKPALNSWFPLNRSGLK